MKLLRFLPFLLVPLAVTAQQTSGIITYEMPLNIDLKDQELPPGVAELLKGQKSEYVLYFNQDAALYQNKEKSEKPEEYNSEGGVRIMRVSSNGGSESKFYSDLKNKQIVRQESLMGKTFLINTPLENVKWKVSGRQKKILNMPCMEAINLSEGDTITAWYTTAIPVSAGPSMMGGLPGMILELNMGQDIHYVAKNIEPANSETQKLIKAPTNGKKVTNDEFNKIQKEKMEELTKEYGGGSGSRVIIKQIGGH